MTQRYAALWLAVGLCLGGPAAAHDRDDDLSFADLLERAGVERISLPRHDREEIDVPRWAWDDHAWTPPGAERWQRHVGDLLERHGKHHGWGHAWGIGDGPWHHGPVPAVPEPGGLATLGAGLVALAWLRRRARR